jgi:hypothetical protein
VAGETTFVFLERSSFLGRWRAVCIPGEPGSFLTMIFGPPTFRDLCVVEQKRISNLGKANKSRRRYSRVMLTRWGAMISACSLAHLAPSGCRSRIAVVHYSPTLVEAAGGGCCPLGGRR